MQPARYSKHSWHIFNASSTGLCASANQRGGDNNPVTVHSVRFFAQWHRRHLRQAKFELLSVSLSVLAGHAWLHISFHFVFL